MRKRRIRLIKLIIIKLLFKFKFLSRLKLIIIIFIFDKSILLSTFLRSRIRFCIFVIIIFINIYLLFIFAFVEKCKKCINYRFVFRLFNVSLKFQIDIVINNVELIFNYRQIYIFYRSKNFLNIFSRFSTRNCVTHCVSFIKNDVDYYYNRFFKFDN